MHDFCTPNADEMNYSELAEKVRYHKQQEGGVRTMCRIVEDYAKERAAEARKIALAEGLNRGVQENAIANAKNLLQETNLSPEKIARCCSLPLEQVLALKEELARKAACVAK